ncbi:MAG: SLC13 family permease [Campylobacterales bacterium]
MLDSRRYISKLVNLNFKHSVPHSIIKFLGSFALAFVVAYLIPFSGLSEDARAAFFILIFSAGLWISEAIPAFAVSLLLIGLEIMLIGFKELDFETNKEWALYLQPWASPLVFLFFAGFVMASAASKTGLDLWLAKRVLLLAGSKPKNVLTALMGVTFILSMFVSITATAAMMITVLLPIIASLKNGNPFAKAALLGVAVAANIGGMGTIIGTPPNAIAVGILGSDAPNFLEWMFLALPPAFLMVFVFRYILIKLYPSNQEEVDLEHIKNMRSESSGDGRFGLDRFVVIITFFLTISLWLSSPLHHIPTTVVSFLPVIVFTIFGITDVEDIRELRWDVIILIVGGLSLGLAISTTGLAEWLADAIAPENASLFILSLTFCYGVVVVSNFMSNTAASNIMLPIIAALALSSGETFVQVAVVSVALSASFAMMLPVSTPPNAIIYSLEKAESKDFFKIGLIAAIIGPMAVWGWFYLFYL